MYGRKPASASPGRWMRPQAIGPREARLPRHRPASRGPRARRAEDLGRQRGRSAAAATAPFTTGTARLGLGVAQDARRAPPAERAPRRRVGEPRRAQEPRRPGPGPAGARPAPPPARRRERSASTGIAVGRAEVDRLGRRRHGHDDVVEVVAACSAGSRCRRRGPCSRAARARAGGATSSLGVAAPTPARARRERQLLEDLVAGGARAAHGTRSRGSMEPSRDASRAGPRLSLAADQHSGTIRPRSPSRRAIEHRDAFRWTHRGTRALPGPRIPWRGRPRRRPSA